MPMLSAVSNELYVNKAFVGLDGAGYQLSGRGYELAGGMGVPKRKIKKAIRDTGKFLSQKCPVPLTVRGTQTLVSFAPLAFKLFYAARHNAVLRRSPFPSP